MIKLSQLDLIISLRGYHWLDLCKDKRELSKVKRRKPFPQQKAIIKAIECDIAMHRFAIKQCNELSRKECL